ncbi:hypothetical protein [Alkalicoccobacillus porphyridii]|uniref:Uncharacterized protein n=1 Tax=Alkalicoccobacillus porphyridii TaxID=2597270 RepID=A0A553ZVR5_9BACI|nr:hypothetical protein [Alkalicoccobacillus porphyridii]TSB45564.1 hypothetical protein FN960_15455 [Alkalicoccobacillus porphyridii]
MNDLFMEHGIAIFSLLVAIIALFLNRKISKLNSYNQHGSYTVYFQKESKIKKWLYGPGFSVKTDNSISSSKLAFNYSLRIKPLLGGVYRSHIFNDLERTESIGTTKTLPVVRTYKNKYKFPDKYAHQDIISFSSSPIYPYFSVNGTFDEEERKYEKRLCRYHRYIEITDYCGNTEIWYISFSLYLSNLEENRHWNKYNEDKNFMYYTFGDFNIVSPRDIRLNLNQTLRFNKDLSTIAGSEKSWGESERFIDIGYDKIDSELQLYEMKEYLLFRSSLKNYDL